MSARWSAAFRARELAFDELVSDAQRLSARGADAEAALAVSIAAEYAWRCPFGRLASPPLERVLQALAKRLPTDLANAHPPDDSVLHIATKALGVGGLSGILCSWIEADAARTHDVVLTDQRDQQLPGRLRPAIAVSNGMLHDLTGMPILERAATLRRLAGAHRYCVVHQDPSDVVPGLALMTQPRDWSTILVDHADHVFWLGTHMADVVAHLRPAAAAMAAAHRGMPEGAATIIPIPLDRSTVEVDRPAARACLGLTADEVLVTSVASEYKYGNDTSGHFLDSFEPILGRYPQLRVLVVGPRLTGRWKATATRFPGQVQAVGPQPDLETYLTAADIYVDSYPLPSFTSAMQAALTGLPTICRRFDHPDLAYLRLEDERVQSAMTWAQRNGDVADIVASWIDDPTARGRAGTAAAQAMRRMPHGRDWLPTLERAYCRAEQRRANSTDRDAGVTHMPAVLAEAIADAHHWGGIDGAFLNVVLRRHDASGVRTHARTGLRTLWRVRRDRQTGRAWQALWRARLRGRLGGS